MTGKIRNRKSAWRLESRPVPPGCGPKRNREPGAFISTNVQIRNSLEQGNCASLNAALIRERTHWLQLLNNSDKNTPATEQNDPEKHRRPAMTISSVQIPVRVLILVDAILLTREVTRSVCVRCLDGLIPCIEHEVLNVVGASWLELRLAVQISANEPPIAKV